MTYVPRDSALDAALSVNASVTFLGTYFCTDTDAKAVKVQNTLFLPPLFVRLLMESYLYRDGSCDGWVGGHGAAFHAAKATME